MNVENTSTEGVTEIIKVEIKVENESDDEVNSERDLYTDHATKEEMVIGPVVLQVVDVTYCPEDVPVPKKPKLETTHEETDQVKPQKGMKEDNTEGLATNIETKTILRNNEKYTIAQRVVRHQNTRQDDRLNIKESTYQTGSQDSLEQLYKLHDKDRNFECDLCGYRCTYKRDWTRHLRTHTDEKPYSCFHCDYKCNHKGILSRHLRIHTGDKPYSCSHCDYKCNQKVHLERHLRTHTGENLYSCSHCDYKCNEKSSLSRHLRIHTGEKPYSCSQCDYKSNDRRNLSKHLLGHTKKLNKGK